jgi:hypothetical protein
VSPQSIPFSVPIHTNQLTINIYHRFDALMVAGIKAPQYLRESAFTAPLKDTEGIVQFAHQTKLSAFPWIASSPHLLSNFNTFMGSTMGGRKYWTDWFPIQERILDGARPDGKLLVDVAGGKGHDVQQFLEKFPETKGRLVLQDLAQALGAATAEVLDESVERMECDFFKEQPLKGERET